MFVSTTDAHSVPLLAGTLSLKEAQSLTGKLNNVCQMCLFLQAFRFPLNKFVASFGSNELILLHPSPQVVLNLRVFAAAILTAVKGLPIPPRTTGPLLSAIVFHSDAAGARFAGSEVAVSPTAVTVIVAALPSVSTLPATSCSTPVSPGRPLSSSTPPTAAAVPTVVKQLPLRLSPSSSRF